MLKEGDRLPDFELRDQNGSTVRAADFAGKPLVVYFYPKDDTPVCTKEACSFRDAHAEIRAKGAAVVGVSADDSASHLKFAKKFNLPFTLLADPEKKLISAFGAWGEKQMYGKTYEGVLRTTFVFGSDGVAKKVFPKVSPEGHAQEILAVL
jgi:peroxiredoxin Q/BCP